MKIKLFFIVVGLVSNHAYAIFEPILGQKFHDYSNSALPTTTLIAIGQYFKQEATPKDSPEVQAYEKILTHCFFGHIGEAPDPVFIANIEAKLLDGINNNSLAEALFSIANSLDLSHAPEEEA